MALIKGALGKEKRHYHSQGDTTGRCPHCYNNNVEKIGVLTIDAVPRDVIKCKQCNTLHSGADGGVQSLLDEAREVFKTENVGFVSQQRLDASDLNNSSNNATVRLDSYNMESKLDMMNSTIQNLNYTIQNLTNEIRSMATQNHNLMEKLMTDPLNGMRKAVSDFNLE